MFKTFTVVGWGLKNVQIYIFFCQLLQKSFSYTKISEILNKNYPNVRALSLPAIKNVGKENDLPSKFSQSDVDEMVSAAVEEI